MEIKLLREPNLLFEAAMLLYNSRNNESCRDLKHAIIKKFAIDPEVLDSCFDAIIELSEHVTRSLSAEDELLDFLFRRHSGMKGCFAFYLIHNACRRTSPSLTADLAALREMPKSMFFINLISLLQAEFAPEDYDGEITNYGELIGFIEQMGIPADEKWDLCRFYNGFDHYRSALCDILAEAAKLYQEKYDIVRHYIGWFLSAVNEPLATGGADFVERNYRITVPGSIDTLYIQPSIMMCNGTRYLMNYTDEREDDYFYVGVLFEPLKEITQSSTLEDKLCRTLRTIGDLRKFEILRLLAESPKYGQQLASLLDLSTATISHHMSLLMESGFVEIKRDANRIYYALNKKKLRDFIDELGSTLLE